MENFSIKSIKHFITITKITPILIAFIYLINEIVGFLGFNDIPLNYIGGISLIPIIYLYHTDECSLDDEEILSIAKNLVHIKLNIEQTCNYIHVSRATLNRMIIDGRVPTPKKTLGGDKYWFQDELDDYIKEHK